MINMIQKTIKKAIQCEHGDFSKPLIENLTPDTDYYYLVNKCGNCGHDVRFDYFIHGDCLEHKCTCGDKQDLEIIDVSYEGVINTLIVTESCNGCNKVFKSIADFTGYTNDEEYTNGIKVVDDFGFKAYRTVDDWNNGKGLTVQCECGCDIPIKLDFSINRKFVIIQCENCRLKERLEI